MKPLLAVGDMDGGLLVGLADIDANATPEHAAALEQGRQINAAAPGRRAARRAGCSSWLAFLRWLLHGRDPVYLDDSSILMPAPPDGPDAGHGHDPARRSDARIGPSPPACSIWPRRARSPSSRNAARSATTRSTPASPTWAGAADRSRIPSMSSSTASSSARKYDRELHRLDAPVSPVERLRYLRRAAREEPPWPRAG